MKVADRDNLSGKVVSVDSSKCRILLDGSGKTAYLFWMLHAAGGSAETNDKLVIGKYNCWVGAQGAGEMRSVFYLQRQTPRRAEDRIESEWRHLLQHDLRPGEVGQNRRQTAG